MKQILTVIILMTSQLNFYAQENNSITCSDGIDNDGDGQIDCLDSDCQMLSEQGCLICTEGISFADSLIEYVSGCPLIADPFPEGALGVSDVTETTGDFPEFVFLGQGGYIKLAFTNNLLTNSGDAQEDLWVFEVGASVEASTIEIRPYDLSTVTELDNLGINDLDQDGYYEVGSIGGSISGLDLDAILPGFDSGSLTFDAIKVVDNSNAFCTGPTPGADIDAVCAISSIAVTSLSELRKDQLITVYPNPADEFILIELATHYGSSPFHYQILSSLGTVHKRGTYIPGARVNISELPKGLFTLQIIAEGTFTTRSFVKQ